MFIVQGSVNLEDSATTRTFVNRSDALATAKSWEDRGKLMIRIIGDGRIYSLEEFARTVDEPDTGVTSTKCCRNGNAGRDQAILDGRCPGLIFDEPAECS